MSERADSRLALLRESPTTRGRTRQLESAVHCATCHAALRFSTQDGRLREACRCGERPVVRRAGELLRAMPKNPGTRTVGGDKRSGGTVKLPPDAPTLADLGVSTLGKAAFGRRLPDLRCGRHST